ncbi:MAG: hypothetical protein V1776_00445 [Candidatus Diapherotrites archaeon]
MARRKSRSRPVKPRQGTVENRRVQTLVRQLVKSGFTPLQETQHLKSGLPLNLQAMSRNVSLEEITRALRIIAQAKYSTKSMFSEEPPRGEIHD